MRCLLIVFLLVQVGVRAELSSSACSVLRTITSLATITPELAQLGIRYYGSSSNSADESRVRAKRFLFNDNSGKDGPPKGTVLDQMVANAFKDVNFTKVAMLMLHNNDTMSKFKQNFDTDAIIRALMHEIDYEKLARSLWYATETEFDLERFLSSLVNITHIDIIHHEFVTNGTIPEWLIKSFHPDLNVQTVNQMFLQLKNKTNQFVQLLSSSDKLEEFLFNTIQQQVLTPMGNIVQRVKDEKPTTLDQLVEIILSDVNKVIQEQLKTTKAPKKTTKKPSTNPLSNTTVVPTEIGMTDDVKLLFYQFSVTLETLGQSTRVFLQAVERLFCTTVWE